MYLCVENGRMTFEIEAGSLKDMFAKIGAVQIFEEEKCGCCGSPDIHFAVRKSKDQQYTFYEVHCNACTAKLEFGQNKDMTNIYAKRHEHPDTGGWFIYQGQGDQQGGGYDSEHGQPPPNQQYGNQGRQTGGGQQGGRPPQQNAPPPQGGNDIPFMWLAPLLVGALSSGFFA